VSTRWLKKAHLQRWRASALAAAYLEYASLGLRHAALHLDLFEPPEEYELSVACMRGTEVADGRGEGSSRRWFKLVLEYDGTAYHGWQVQPGLDTIQGRLEAALARLAGRAVHVMGAGRTDAGVHALGQVASCSGEIRLDDLALRRALNALLPTDIVVRDVATVPSEFDARRSARSKTYRYTLLRRPFPSALEGRYSLYVPYALDAEAMQDAARCLIGTHDFSAFRAGTCGAATPIRTVTRASWETTGDLWLFHIVGNAFLQHMVRIIVGTLLDVGRARRRPGDVADILASRDRRRAGKTAPPQGLCLVEVEY
jgi:tRNA pseudouridine38-40 synthase